MPMSHEQAVAAGRRTAEVRWGNKRGKQAKQSRGHVVGFYNDHGKTKPITKSEAELNRKKLVQNPREFKGVSARAKGVGVAPAVRDLSQKLEDLTMEYHLAEDHVNLLREEQVKLEAEGKQSSELTAEIGKSTARLKLLRDKIAGLRSS